jgi:hypothetical protein
MFSNTGTPPHQIELMCRVRFDTRLNDIVWSGSISPPNRLHHHGRRVSSRFPSELKLRNTGFPCLLRLIIWILFKLSPEGSVHKETFSFLLDHPRRCFTLLFPTSATWWLVGVLLILNLCDLFFFIVLDASNPYVLSIPVGYRWLDGLFQVPPPTRSGSVGFM